MRHSSSTEDKPDTFDSRLDKGSIQEHKQAAPDEKYRNFISVFVSRVILFVDTHRYSNHRDPSLRYLVVAPIINEPTLDFLNAAFFILAGFILYFPFVHFGYHPKFMGKCSVFICKILLPVPGVSL